MGKLLRHRFSRVHVGAFAAEPLTRLWNKRILGRRIYGIALNVCTTLVGNPFVLRQRKRFIRGVLYTALGISLEVGAYVTPQDIARLVPVNAQPTLRRWRRVPVRDGSLIQ